jgi:hypothetical protein
MTTIQIDADLASRISDYVQADNAYHAALYMEQPDEVACKDLREVRDRAARLLSMGVAAASGVR